MLSEQSVSPWSNAKKLCCRLRASPKVVLNLSMVIALFVVLGPMRSLFYANLSPQEQARAVEKLTNAFRLHLAELGLDVQDTQAQDQEIWLVGPPDGTLYEKAEEVTLRWSYEPSLDPGESYVVAVAYFKRNYVSIPLQPVIRHFSTTEEVFQLPLLDVEWNIPVVAWTVYVASEVPDAPTGPVSGTYRLFHMLRHEFDSGYIKDGGL